jgi:hypothetical protein
MSADARFERASHRHYQKVAVASGRKIKPRSQTPPRCRTIAGSSRLISITQILPHDINVRQAALNFC